MSKHGELFVFEGPDGVGKSTLTAMFAEELRQRGVATMQLSFPGRAPGTLGRAVYEIHHDPKTHGINGLTQSSLQALHIAAHLDVIEREIIPASRCGTTVILDRFWWSTWVYGLVGGVKPELLQDLLEVERKQWGEFLPTTIFLITKSRSWREDEPQKQWEDLAAAYRDLAAKENKGCPVEIVSNEGLPEEAFARIINAARQHCQSEHFLASLTEQKGFHT